MAPPPSIVLAERDDEPRRVRGRRRLRRARAGTRDDAGGGDRGADHVGAAWTRRRVLPGRPQVVVRPVEGSAAQAALPRDQRRRVGAGQLQGQRDPVARPASLHRGLPHHRTRHRLATCLRLHPRRVQRAVRDPRRRARGAEGPSGDQRRRDDRRAPRRRRLHLRRGDGPPRVARGQARPAALEAAVPRDLGPLRVPDGRQQRRDDRHRRARDLDGRRGVREARRPEHARLARRLALRATS